jgi:hypothetical protein
MTPREPRTDDVAVAIQLGPLRRWAFALIAIPFVDDEELGL